ACGIGGDLFALIYWAKEGRVRFLNGSGRTPAATDVALLQSGAAMPQRGIRSVSVPGCVDAWFTMHEAYGSLPVAELLAPAIRLADQGFPISDKMAAAIAATLKLDPHPSWTATYAPQGRAPKAGSRLVQRDLARSLTLIAEGGRAAFYEGPIARAIVDLSDSLGGWFPLEDLALHSTDWGEPIQTEYRGY